MDNGYELNWLLRSGLVLKIKNKNKNKTIYIYSCTTWLRMFSHSRMRMTGEKRSSSETNSFVLIDPNTKSTWVIPTYSDVHCTQLNFYTRDEHMCKGSLFL